MPKNSCRSSKSDDQAQPIDAHCENGGDNDLAGHSVRSWNQSQEIAEKNEKKEGGDKGEKPQAFLAHRVQDHSADKIYQQLRETLQLGGNKAYASGRRQPAIRRRGQLSPT